MAAPLPDSAQRVQAALAAAGAAADVIEMPGSTRTAEDAAAACGVSVGQIAKSLIFRCEPSGRALLAIVSGSNRVHEKRLGRQIGETLARADADFVRAATGYAIGGVPPLPSGDMIVIIDPALFAYDVVWAAAGTPRCVFKTDAETLMRLSGAQRIDPT